MLANFKHMFSRNYAIGFTLLDLLIAVFIIAILGMTISPQLGDMANETKLNNAAKELVSALQYAQILAVEYQRPFQVKVYTAASRNQFLVKDYTSPLDANIHADADPPLYTYHRVYNPIDKKPYIIDFDDVQAAIAGDVSPRREYSGVTIDSVPGGGNDGIINFYPDGHTGNTDSIVAISLGKKAKFITVDGFTGKVTAD